MRDLIILLVLMGLAGLTYAVVVTLARGGASCVGCGHMNHLHQREMGCVAAGQSQAVCSCAAVPA
jgi:hypothetical protein